ncbi:MAG: PF20097 family protein [Beduini sp.]|uniref:PF20097 family protein n=1 Tax=Beduini sp. TaxID=1922300 RepID=UPI0039A32B68
MNCPKCGKEMQSGYLQTNKIMAFNQHIHKLSLLPKDEGDLLIVNNTVRGANFKGFICKDCGLIVFDYTQSNVKE